MGELILSRKVNQRIFIGDKIIIRIAKIVGGQVQIAINAPADIAIQREEIRQVFGPDNPRTEGQMRGQIERHKQMGRDKLKRLY